MKKVILQSGRYYHIYNRTKNGDPLFIDEDDCKFFLELYKTHVVPMAETYAYCLLHDHLHFLIKIRDDTNGNTYKSFAILFNSYAKRYNKKNARSGKEFQFKLKRIEVRRDSVFKDLVKYINLNPCKHGEAEHPADFRYCSFRATFTQHPTLILKYELAERFGDRHALLNSFQEPANEILLKRYMLE